MKGFWLAIAWMGASHFGASCLLAEDAPSADEVLDQWQAAFQNCRSFEAKVTVYQYNFGGNKADETYEGHYYYEAPGNGRFQLSNGEEFVWLNGDVFADASGLKRYQQFTAAFVEATLQEVLKLEQRGWGFFGGIKIGLYRNCARPTGPVFLAPWRDRAEGWREKQKLSAEIHEGQLFLSGVGQRRRHCEAQENWSVVIDRETNLPWAVELSTDGSSRRVLVFSDVCVNETPTNRNELLGLKHPDWDVELFDWLEDDGLRE